MSETGEFLSCDWGSTSLRLRWVRHLTVLHEIRAPVGVRFLYEEALRGGASTEILRASVFARFIRGKIEALFSEGGTPGTPLPLLISGMASSSVGWRELPYAKVPFPIDGSGVTREELGWDKPLGVGQTILISGVATATEMMRGEETEILGLMADPAQCAHRERCLLILPGTHSKHVLIENHSVVDWRTFMTGELFEVLGMQSLLRASVELPPRDGPLAANRSAFEEGARIAREDGLARSLFRVRTRAVLGRRPLPENTWFLSGLLIGAEVTTLETFADGRPLLLAAVGELAELYRLALNVLMPQNVRWDSIPPERVQQAVPLAHATILAG